MILKKGKQYLSLLAAFILGAVFAVIFTKLLKWSIVLIILAVISTVVILWVRKRFTRPSPTGN